MMINNKKYLDDQGLSTIADYIKERLKTVSAMPASAGNGTVLLYTGETNSSYINGHIYQYDVSTNSWIDISPSGGGSSSSASDVTYDNEQSGLSASNVQSAIDEIADGGGSGGMSTDGTNADTSVTFPNSAFTVGSRNSYFDNGIIEEWENLTINGTINYDFYNGSAVVYNNKIHILGGNGSYTAHYSFDKNSWTEESTLPYNFYSGAAVVYDNKIHILGGYAIPKKHYSWNGTSWTEESTLPYDFAFGSAVVYDNKIHIFGGSGGYKKHYSWNGTSWAEESTLPYNFSRGSAVVYDNKIHILGGEGSSYYKKHYSWNGTSWSSRSTLPYNFYSGAAVVYDNKIHILGSDGGNYKSCYSWDGTSWILQRTLPYIFYQGSAVVYDDRLNIIGSYDSSARKFHYDTSVLDDYAWSKVVGAMQSLPYTFYGGAAVVYDNKIHILGSREYSFYTKHYSWDGISWTEESTLPYDFAFGSAVVYDNKIHIFGGSGGYKKHYSWNGTSWAEESTLPYNFCQGSAVVYDNKIHILGSSENSSYYKYHYSWDGTRWASVSTLPYSFYGGAAVVYDNEIHILGGSGGSVHYSYNGSTWTQISGGVPAGFTSGFPAIVYNGKINIFQNSTNPNRYYFKVSSSEWIKDDKSNPYLFAYTSVVIYNGYIYALGGSSTPAPYISFYRLNHYPDIIEITDPEKPGTIVQGDQSMASGDYSYARGFNCLAKGDYSKAEGINSYAISDFQSLFKGSSNKFGIEEFAYGRSLYNNVINASLTSGTAIDGRYGCSGTVAKSSSAITTFIKIDSAGVYLLFIAEYPSGIHSAYLISHGKSTRFDLITSSSSMSYHTVNNPAPYDTINFSSNANKMNQFTLIRLI